MTDKLTSRTRLSQAAGLKETKPRGRPRELQGGRRINVYLDQESLDRAEILGEGNLSLGVRRALKIED